MNNREKLKDKQRIVVKVGTSSLIHKATGNINLFRLEKLVRVLTDLHNSGKDVILHIIGMIGVDGALYKSMEFTGDGVKHLTMDDRLTICNMSIEAGGKNGIFPVDETTVQYIKEHGDRPYTVYEADEDAVYDAVYTIDLAALKPTVAFPHLPENTKEMGNFEEVKIDQVVIGSCTNGRIQDIRQAAEILKGRKVAKNVRCIVIPATQSIYLSASPRA